MDRRMVPSTRVLLSFTVAAATFTAAPRTLWAQEDIGTPGASDVVLRVNGRSILASEIEVSLSQAEKQFRKQYDRSPAPTDRDRASVAAIHQELAFQQAAKVIRAKLRDMVLEEFGITVTDAEVNAYWSELTAGQDARKATKALAEQKDKYADILAALVDVYDRGAKPDDVFSARLEGRVSPEAWRLYLEEYATVEERARLRLMIEQRPAMPDGPDAGIAAVLINRKLDARIDREIASHDDRYARFLACAEDKANCLNSDGRELEFPMTYRRTEHEAWWRRKVAAADIQVLQPEYEDAVKRFCEVYQQ